MLKLKNDVAFSEFAIPKLSTENYHKSHTPTISSLHMIFEQDFSLSRCLENLQKLTEHFIEVFREMHELLPMSTFMENQQAELRCNLMAKHLLHWNMFAIFGPELVKVDLFSMLKSQNGTIFSPVSVRPNGVSFQKEQKFKKLYFRT